VDGWKFGRGVLVTDERRQTHYGQYYRSRTEHIPNHFRATENAYCMSKHLPRPLVHAVALGPDVAHGCSGPSAVAHSGKGQQSFPHSVLAGLSDL
jgi:hypothetical protein